MALKIDAKFEEKRLVLTLALLTAGFFTFDRYRNLSTNLS